MKRIWLTLVVCLAFSVVAAYETYVAFKQDAVEAASWTHTYCPSTSTTVPVVDPRDVVVLVECPDGFSRQATVVKVKYYEYNFATSVWSRDGTHWIEGEVKDDGNVTPQPYQGSGPLCAALLAFLLVASAGILIDGRRRLKKKPPTVAELNPA